MHFQVGDVKYQLPEVFIESYFGRLWQFESTRSQLKDEKLEFVALKDFTIEDARIIFTYLNQGRVSSDDVEKLLSILDYTNFEVPRVLDYPIEFLRLKLEEMWFRKYYHTLHPESRLIKVDATFASKIAALYKARFNYLPDENVGRDDFGVIEDFDQRRRCAIDAKYNQMLVQASLRDLNADRLLHRLISNHRPRETTLSRHKTRTKLLNAMFSNFFILNGEGDPENLGVLSKSTFGQYRCLYHYLKECGKDRQVYTEDEELFVLMREEAAAFLFDGTCSLNGGAVLDYISGSKLAIKDFDVFFHNTTSEKALEKIEAFAKLVPGTIFRTANSITLGPIQFILRIYTSQEEVLTGFDLDASCIGYDGKDIWMTPRCQYSLEKRTLFVDFDMLSPSYEYRLCKYGQRKLFSIYVPEYSPDLSRCRALTLGSEKILTVHVGLEALIFWQLTGNLPREISDYSKSKARLLSMISAKVDPQDVIEEILLDLDNKPTISDGTIKLEFGGVPLGNVIVSRVISSHFDCLRQIPEYFWDLLRFDLTREIQLVYKPGQILGTFHSKVLDDLNLWYRGHRIPE